MIINLLLHKILFDCCQIHVNFSTSSSGASEIRIILTLSPFAVRRYRIPSGPICAVSNQVQYSIIDQRPDVTMASFCKKHNMKLLAYGTLLGGLLTEKYLGATEPTRINCISCRFSVWTKLYSSTVMPWCTWNVIYDNLLVS